MNAPFEKPEFPVGVCLQIERIQKNLVTLAQATEFLQDIVQGKLQDNSGKPIDMFSLCHFLFSSEIHYLHTLVLGYIKRHLCCPELDPGLQALCEHYSSTSGLALFIRTFDSEHTRNSAKQLQALEKAASLKNGNAMEELCIFYRPQEVTINGTTNLSEKDYWKYLNKAAQLGSTYASIQLSKIYLGKGHVKVPLDLNNVLKILTRALPSSEGLLEYELYLLLKWGYRTNDGQMIVADPQKANQYLIIAAKKSNHEGICQTLEWDKRYEERASFLPSTISDSLLRIQGETKVRPKDVITVANYIEALQLYSDISSLIAFLISRHFIYLPPRIFRILSKKIESHYGQSGMISLTSESNSSPLIKSLCYPRSLFLQQNNPHAEYMAYNLYISGGKVVEVNSDKSQVVIKPSVEEAKRYLQRAAENGHAEAQLVLGQKLLERGQVTAGVRLLNKACDQFNSDAMLTLATHYWSVFDADRVPNFKIGQTALHYYSMAREYGWRPDFDFEDRMKIIANISQIAKTSVPSTRNMRDITYTEESQVPDERSPIFSK